MSPPRAVVLTSGGLDSATTLGLAREAGFACHALSIDYGQRHRVELKAAASLAERLGAVEHRQLSIDLRMVGGSALTDSRIAVPTEASPGIPVTYVPARNTLFLALALGWAEVLEADALYIGVNAVDYSGYPDCRPDFVAAFETLANLATRRGVEGQSIRIAAPLLYWSKAEIIQAAVRLGVPLAETISCYDPDDAGRACRRCDACRLRREGFTEAGVPDPTPYQ